MSDLILVFGCLGLIYSLPVESSQLLRCTLS